MADILGEGIPLDVKIRWENNLKLILDGWDIGAWTEWKCLVLFSKWNIFGNTTGLEYIEFLYLSAAQKDRL